MLDISFVFDSALSIGKNNVIGSFHSHGNESLICTIKKEDRMHFNVQAGISFKPSEAAKNR